MLEQPEYNRPVFLLATKAVEHDEDVSLQDVIDAINAGEVRGARSDNGWLVDINDFKQWRKLKVAGLEEKDQTENHDAKQNYISEILSLSDKELAFYNGEASRNKLNLGTAYLLWALTGWAGGHKLYQNKPWGLIYPILSIWGLSNYFMSVTRIIEGLSYGLSRPTILAREYTQAGMIILGCWGIFMLMDLISLPDQIATYNQNVRENILKQLKEQH